MYIYKYTIYMKHKQCIVDVIVIIEICTLHTAFQFYLHGYMFRITLTRYSVFVDEN